MLNTILSFITQFLDKIYNYICENINIQNNYSYNFDVIKNIIFVLNIIYFTNILMYKYNFIYRKIYEIVGQKKVKQNLQIHKNFVNFNNIILPYNKNYDNAMFLSLQIYAYFPYKGSKLSEGFEKIDIKRLPGIDYNFTSNEIGANHIIVFLYDKEIKFESNEVLNNDSIALKLYLDDFKKIPVKTENTSTEDEYDNDF